MGIAVGIDLGTTYSAVGMIDPVTGRARIIPTRDGAAVTPSVVAVMPDGTVLFGEDAKEQQELGYTGTAAFFKRSMGDEDFALPLCGRDYTAVDLSAMLLRGLVEQAEEVSGEHIDAAYVTVPAYFRNREREATLAAARQAGLNVLGLLNEPTAAAFAYGLNGNGRHQTALVYDLGGGTFDVTLARIDEDEIRILGSDGDHQLGGKDWDNAVEMWIAENFKEEFGVDPTEDPETLAQIGVLAEQAKKRLSKSAYADITVSCQGHRGKYRLSREEFDQITAYMLQETADVVDRLFASIDPPMSWKDVDGTILVGGSTRMCQVPEYVERVSGKKPLGGVNVDEAVALGAAIRANQDASGATRMPTLGGRPVRPVLGSKKIVDATAHALGMINESKDGERYVNNILIPKNSPVPARFTKTVEMRVPRTGGRSEVYLLQGGEPAPLDNDVAGLYVFDVPFPGGDGTTRLNVTYSYDENSVIEVSAEQVETGARLAMHREPVPDDMEWVNRSPKENAPAAAMPTVTGEVYLYVDFSGSMWGEPIRKTSEAVIDFAKAIPLGPFKLGVVCFGNTVGGLLRSTDDFAKIERCAKGLVDKFKGYPVGGGTNNPLPSLVNGLFSDGCDQKIAVFLTDGDWSSRSNPLMDAQNAWNSGIDTIGVGFGDANEEFLRSISSVKDLSGLTDLGHLSESFSTIAREIGTGGGLVSR